jgi:transcription initiation factor TFIIIB Brf1 subunit/transcription initiation factor TFIIB
VTCEIEDIRAMAEHFNISHVARKATKYFKDFVDAENEETKNFAEAGCACLYLACRYLNAPHTIGEISKLRQTDVEKMFSYIEKVIDKLNISFPGNNSGIEPEKLIPRFCGNLGKINF